MASDCSRYAACGQGRAAIEHANVVEAHEAALEDIVILGVFAIDPPGEVEQQLVKDAFEKNQIAAAAAFLLDLIDAQRRPSMHRRVDVAQGPFVGRQLAVGVHVPLAQEKQELILGEVGVDKRKAHAMEREVPGGVPGILPLIGHRNDVGVVEVRPVRIAALEACRRGLRIRRVAFEPFVNVVVIELLRPEQPGQCLSHDLLSVGRKPLGGWLWRRIRPLRFFAGEKHRQNPRKLRLHRA